MKAVINMAQPRRGFLKQTTIAAALAISPFASRAQQRDDAEPAASAASSAVITTFDDVWRTVRDRFYDPQLHGLDWSAVREHYLPDAAKAASDEALATVINRMLARLQASHAHYYTSDEP
jgi:carboxyl-terminal processing protease